MKTFDEHAIEERWEKTNLLKGLEGETKTNCALTMNKQLGFNESQQNSTTFKRVNIPIVRRLFGYLPNLKSVTTGNWIDTGVVPTWVECQQYDGHGIHYLEAESKSIAVDAENLALKIKEMISDKLIEGIGGVWLINNTYHIHA